MKIYGKWLAIVLLDVLIKILASIHMGTFIIILMLSFDIFTIYYTLKTLRFTYWRFFDTDKNEAL
jgi:hypothetical protein